MATIVITNLSSSKIYLSDLAHTLDVGGSVTTERPASALSAMVGLQKAIEAGSVSLTSTPTPEEIASGLMTAPNSITGDDMAEVASTAVLSPEIIIRKAVTAGGGGAADDVTVYAANALPFKFRIIDAWCFISAGNAGGRTITIRDQAAGAGTSAGTLDAAALGRVDLTPASNASTVFTPGTLIGVFLRRSDSAIAGEVFIKVRRES